MSYPIRDESSWSELKIQSEAFQYLVNNYPALQGCLYHVPNEGQRSFVTGALLNGAGLTKGIQDLHLLWKGKLWLIEVKTGTGELSIDQKIIHARHKVQGFDTYVVHSSAELVYLVEDIMLGSVHNFYLSKYSYAELLPHLIEEKRLLATIKAGKKLNAHEVVKDLQLELAKVRAITHFIK